MPIIRGRLVMKFEYPGRDLLGAPFPSCAQTFDHLPTNVAAAEQTVVDRKPCSPAFAQSRITIDGPGSLQHPKSSIVRLLVAGKVHRGTSRSKNRPVSTIWVISRSTALEDLAGSTLLHSLYHR